MAETSEDLELFHYGVKGMRWGVTRPVDSDGYAKGKPPGKKKQLKTDRVEKIKSTNKKVYEIEEKMDDEINARAASNRAKGMGRYAANKEAVDAVMPKHMKKMEKLEGDLEKADADYKQGRQDMKTARKADRREVAGHLGKNYSLKNNTGRINSSVSAGAVVAGTLLGGPLGGVAMAERSLGTSLARSAGYSRGSSIAIGLLGGSVGGLAAAEFAVRTRANRPD